MRCLRRQRPGQLDSVSADTRFHLRERQTIETNAHEMNRSSAVNL